jgi:hypothetical protein
MLIELHCERNFNNESFDIKKDSCVNDHKTKKDDER